MFHSDRSRNVPFWELLVHTPAVFVRVANKGVTGYGTWKSAEAIEKTGVREAFVAVDGATGRADRIGRLWRGWVRRRTIYYNMEEVKVK